MRFPPSGIHCPQCGFLILPTPLSGTAAEKRRLKQEQYSKIGKKCHDCHGYKPVADYYRNAASTDELQAVCKSCIALQHSLRKLDNARQLWRTTRDQLRAQNDAANKAAGLP